MIKLSSKFIRDLCLIISVFSLLFVPFNLNVNASTFNQNDQLIERISKDFSKKFCNGIAFGLSQESAMNFAMKENMAIFKKKKGIENIDNKTLIAKVSMSVIDKCGYTLDLSEQQWFSSIE
tara:strand:+ start:91 stop:453 length:363 start_codon:yes stop_codon:yes gene_type:complete